jgi:hypothetical protein
MIKSWGDVRFKIRNPSRTGLKSGPHFFPFCRVRIPWLGSVTSGVIHLPLAEALDRKSSY